MIENISGMFILIWYHNFEPFCTATREKSCDPRLSIIALFKLTSLVDSLYLIRFSCFVEPYLELYLIYLFHRRSRQSKQYFLHYFCLKLSSILLSWSCHYHMINIFLILLVYFIYFSFLICFKIFCLMKIATTSSKSQPRDTLVFSWLCI